MRKIPYQQPGPHKGPQAKSLGRGKRGQGATFKKTKTIDELYIVFFPLRLASFFLFLDRLPHPRPPLPSHHLYLIKIIFFYCLFYFFCGRGE